MKTIRLILSAFVFILSGKRICTKSMRDLAAIKTAEWEEKKRKLQEELDKEHSITWRKPVKNGQFIEEEKETITARVGVMRRCL